MCFSFPFQAKQKIDGNAEALGGCCRFWAGSGGGLSDSTGRRTDGGTGGMWWLFLSLSRRSHAHTHTHTHKLKESGKMIAGMVSRDGNTESCLSLRFGPWWSGGLGGGRFWALSFWESLKYLTNWMVGPGQKWWRQGRMLDSVSVRCRYTTPGREGES